ncbi:MAG: flippase-like domain-containing protein [Bacteroidales bacterium]|nr:flippase-like domain-containing protein [Bacteroidales bacterium]MBQ8461949.1 flippase-like domain-containing protein [Bacteroidales bacterium]
MEKKKGDILKYILFGGLAVALLWLSFREVDWDKFVDGLKNCDWQYVFLSMLIGIYAIWVRSRRWRETLLPTDPSITRITTFNAMNIGYMVNMVIPRGGELARCGLITRHSARDKDGNRLASFDKVIGTILVDRVWDIVVMLLVIAVVIFAFKERWGEFFTDKLGTANFSSTGIVLIAIALVVAILALCYFLRNKNKFFGKIWGFVAGILSGVKSSFKLESWPRFLMFTLLLWMSYWATSATALIALSGSGLGFEALGPIDALFLMAVGTISSIIPVPGGFGAYHYMITMSLSTIYDIPVETGMIFAVLSHESQALAQILCGAASYVHETVRK